MATVEVVFDRSDSVLAAIRWAAARAVTQTAAGVQVRAQRKIADPPKTGRVYHSKTKPSPHQASAPGQPPADWTGALHNAVETGLPVQTAAGTEAIVRVNKAEAPYGAKFLEFGSPSGKIAPRPFFYNSVSEEAPEFVERVKDQVQKAVSGF